MSERVLIVDDEANMRWVLGEALKTAGFDAHGVGSGQEALARLAEAPCDLVILDQKLKGMDGLSTLRRIRERRPEITVILLTAYGTVASAVEAMQAGAADYLRKPFDVEELIFKIQRALERRTLQSEVRRLRALSQRTQAQDPVGSHPHFRQALEQVRMHATFSSDFLLSGEAGSGKTLLARWSHAISPQAAAPLVELDAQALTQEQLVVLLEGEAGREGGRQLAGTGTLLLRHVHALTTSGWNYLSEHWLADRPHPRLVLTGETFPPEKTALRRLPIVQVPPLREHAEDIVYLARYFAPTKTLAPRVLSLLERYPWPDNIAELRHTIERASLLAGADPIEERHLPERIRDAPLPDRPIALPREGINLEEVEVALIRQALERAGGNKTRAAELLGLSRHTLLYRLEKYRLNPPEQKEQ
jgi:two-component system response regulator AtoC